MQYTIKAIPTTYAGVNFRSRLEARWGAFFDLAGIKWDYEPFDLDGWAPDFLLRSNGDDILVEVKPVNFDDPTNAFSKAYAHNGSHIILLLGVRPYCDDLIGPIIVKHEAMRLDRSAVYVNGNELLWRQAGNVIQWQAVAQEQSSSFDDRPRFHLQWSENQLAICSRIREAASKREIARKAA